MTKRTGMTLGVTAVVMIIFALVVVVGSSNRACSACHTELAHALDKDAHASSSCYSCHLDRGAWSYPAFKAQELFVMYPTALLKGNELTSPPQETSSEACLRCHADVTQDVMEVDGLRIAHEYCSPSASCDGCHSAEGHGTAIRYVREATMDECIACHKVERAPQECDSCHQEKRAEERLTEGAWNITHGSDWKTMHGMGDLETCSTCHPSGYCERCHAVDLPHPLDFGSTHGQYAIADRDSCLTCHKSERFCDSCHGVPMPHPKKYLQTHSKTTPSHNEERCFRCHAADDCENCHSYHVHPGGAGLAGGAGAQ